MESDKEWEEKVRKFFELLKGKKKKISADINGVKVYIFPNVFSPEVFFESRWYDEKLAKIVGKKSLLEIGTGSGIISLFSALKGARITATDINPDAVKNAKCNFSKHKLRVNTYLG